MADSRVCIRPVADLEQLSVVEGLMAQELDDWANSWRGASFFRARFPDDADLMLTAEEAGTVIGGLLAHTDQSGASIDGLAVVPARRHTGVGRALLETLESHAGARGLEEIALGASEAAVGFYRHCGFKASVLIQFPPAVGDPEPRIAGLLAGPLAGRQVHRAQFRSAAQLIVNVEADDDPLVSLLRSQHPVLHTGFLVRKRLHPTGPRV